MSYFKRRLSIPILLLLLLGAAACASNTSPPTGIPGPTAFTISADSLPKNAAGVPLVARINSAEITLPQFERTLARYQQQPMGDPQGLPKTVLTAMVQQELIDEAAAASQVTVSPTQIDQEVQSLQSDAGGASQFQKWLQDNLYTEDELRESLRETLITNLMRDRITSDLQGNLPQVHARHILVETEDEANGLLVRLRNGEDFGALARQYSLDTTTSINGGDLGWFTQEELLEPELAKVAFQLQPGQVAGPIQSTLGYDIIQTLEKQDRPVDASRQAQLAQRRFDQWLDTLTQSAKIEEYL